MTEPANRLAESDVELAAARAVIAQAESSDHTPPVSDQALLAAQQGQRTVLLWAEDITALAADPPVPDAVSISGQGEIDLVTRPAKRGRGIASAALRALIERGADPGDPPTVKAWQHGESPAAAAVLEHGGFRPVRELLLMELDPELLPSAVDPEGANVTGARIRPYEGGADAEAWVEVNARAFATHPEQGRITVTDFALLRQEPWFRADDLLLLEDEISGKLIGSSWIKTETSATGTSCELYAIGVDPQYAGRGAGRALLSATLHRMADHRPAGVTLYVDGDNERAIELYERAGFTVRSRSRQWERPISRRDSVPQ